MIAASPSFTDPVALTQRLIRCASVTPADEGALDAVASVLTGAGFDCTRVDRNGTPNLFARWGRKGANRTFGFNGHTDVVPAGDAAAWTHAPFAGEIADGILWGRGATDMKSGVAAFVAAACDFVRDTPPDGAVIVAVTGDEEGPGRDGTVAILDWMTAQGEAMSVCLVGEPTSAQTLGDTMKIGRRGSMTVRFTAHGVQGHSAYPDRAVNPLHTLVWLLDRIATHDLDNGTGHFDRSTIAVTTIDTGNTASNVIPARATAVVNIRFNDAHTGDSLTRWLQGEVAHAMNFSAVRIEMSADVSGESFLTPPGPLSDLVADAVQAGTGVRPVPSTTGGTSDARFVKDHCPVVEFGLVGKTMHQVDEHVPVAQIEALKRIYGRILAGYFA
jgi:succinyl-diaminopimelate desuccinylase